MNFSVKGFDSSVNSLDKTITKIDFWYDRHTRCWIVQRLNAAGDQIGNADYVYTKAEAIWLTENYKTEYGIER